MIQKIHTVAQLSVYPIKSTAGIDISSVYTDMLGMAFDRRFIIANVNGDMFTARKYPQLLQVKSALTEKGMQLSYKDKPSISVNYDDISTNLHNGIIWGDNFNGYQANDAVNQWFSDIVDDKVLLLHMHKDANRFGSKAQQLVSFADAYPLLIIGTASLAELNKRSPITHSMRQFRPNIVVETNQPFIEDTWQKIAINGTVIQLTEPCARCVLTTINPKNSEKFANAEPIKTLTTFRKSSDNAIHFGMNANVEVTGVISVGDEIEVISKQETVA